MFKIILYPLQYLYRPSRRCFDIPFKRRTKTQITASPSLSIASSSQKRVLWQDCGNLHWIAFPNDDKRSLPDDEGFPGSKVPLAAVVSGSLSSFSRARDSLPPGRNYRVNDGDVCWFSLQPIHTEPLIRQIIHRHVVKRMDFVPTRNDQQQVAWGKINDRGQVNFGWSWLRRGGYQRLYLIKAWRDKSM